MKSKSTRNNKGFTLVELIVAIFVLTVISAVISRIVILSARQYKRSYMQTVITNEAQNVTNQLNHMIMDATDSVEFFDASKTLEIINSNGSNTKTIVYNASDMSLTYFENGADYGKLADYVSYFEADTSDFEENRTVYFNIGFQYEAMSYSSEFYVTSRNEDTGEEVEIEETVVFRVSPKEIYLEPNQTYSLKCRTIGGSGQFRVSSIDGCSDGSTSVTPASDYNSLKFSIGNNETGNGSGIFYVNLVSEDRNNSGSPKATATITVRIRRVTGLNAVITLISGTDYKKDAVYEISTRVAGTHFEKKVGMSYDNDYCDPKKVDFSLNYTADKASVSTGAYFEKISSSGSNACRFRLLQDMVDESSLEIEITAGHPEGQNKTGIKYGSFKQKLKLTKGISVIKVNDLEEDFKRGGTQNNVFNVGNIAGSLQTIYKQEYYHETFDKKANRGLYFYRFREITEEGYGEWTPYRATSNGQGSTSLQLQANETKRLRPDKYYQVQILYAVLDKYDASANTLFYPIDDYLVETENTGFTNFIKGWNIKNAASTTIDTELAECSKTFNVGMVKMTYVVGYTNDWKNITVETLGSMEEPKILRNGEELYSRYDLKFNEFGKTSEMPLSIMKAKVEKYVMGAWSEYANFNMVSIANEAVRVRNNNQSPGLYRVKFYLENYPVYSDGENLFDTNYKIIDYMDADLFDENEDTGMIYFEIP